MVEHCNEQPSGLAENEVTEKVIGAAIEVHRHLGPGLLESAYEQCLCYELSQMGLQFKRQVPLPIHYEGVCLESAHKMDLLVADAVVVEIKATENMPPVYSSQLLTYLKFSGKRVGLLINFNVPVLKSGLKRIVNHYTGPDLPARISASSEAEISNSSPRVPPRPRVSASSEDFSAPSDVELSVSSPRVSPRPRVSASSDDFSAPSVFSPSSEDLS